MPSPENPNSSPQESQLRNDKESSFYYEAARFPNEQFSGLIYFAVQEIVFNASEEDLSAYRFQLQQLWHVAALGTMPAEEVQEQIHQELSKGEIVELPDPIVNALYQRREQQTKLGSWVEGHHRPGIEIPRPPPDQKPPPLSFAVHNDPDSGRLRQGMQCRKFSAGMYH